MASTNADRIKAYKDRRKADTSKLTPAEQTILEFIRQSKDGCTLKEIVEGVKFYNSRYINRGCMKQLRDGRHVTWRVVGVRNEKVYMIPREDV